jgi:competence protein ComEC
VVLEFLRQQGITELDVMVASHADSDHIGGLIDILEANEIVVLQVMYNGYPGDTATWSDFAAAVAADGLTLTAVQFPAEIQWGLMQVYVLNPASGLGDPETNDASLVFRIDHGEINYLFTGDIDSTIEATVVARGTPVAAEILKVPHHGSKYSSSAEFLAAVSPLEAVISVGENSYGHPAGETLARLEAAGARIWRTDLEGNILAESDGETYQIFAGSSTGETWIYLPVIIRDVVPTPTPTPTPTSTQTITNPPPEPTNTPTPTNQPPANSGDVDIVSVFFDGSSSQEPDEYVEIENVDTVTIQMASWTLSDAANHVFDFPAFLIQPGQTCRVYTDENHPEWCGFNYGSGSAIWNNSGDTATLKDANGTLVDTYIYP